MNRKANSILGIICIVIGLLLINQYHSIMNDAFMLAKYDLSLDSYLFFGKRVDVFFIQNLCLYLIYAFIIAGLIFLILSNLNYTHSFE